MKIKLIYKNFKELIPFSKIFFDICLPLIKITKTLGFIFLIFYILFSLCFSRVMIDYNFISTLVCLIIISRVHYLYAIVSFKKFNNKTGIINLNENNIDLQSKGILEINRKKSNVINEHELVLVLNVKKSFLNIGLYITDQCCNEEDLRQIITYINSGK